MRSEIVENPSVILSGPTGIGKTEIAVRLALRHGFELISADSMQVYRGMEIGTAQPSEEELRGVRIYCCGVLDPDEPFSVKRFLEMSDGAREEILSRGARPLYVGGTGMYLRALRWGLFEEVGDSRDASVKKDDIRRELQAELDEIGVEGMHAKLQAVDSVSAKRTSPHDRVRIIRALEVAKLTGVSLSQLQQEWDRSKPRFPHKLIVLSCPRETLLARINGRVDSMLESGWIEETRRLLEKGYSPDLHCFKALGYREIIRFLHGEVSESAMRERIKAQTRQFSKRQMTWFRKERETQWIEYDGIDLNGVTGLVENLLVSNFLAR